MLRWIAAARARLVPPAPRAGALLLDVGCGGGLLAPELRGHGYRHVGVDLSGSALRAARAHGVDVVRGDAARLPFRDDGFDAVVVGELLEHVRDHAAVVAEACRVLRAGGTLVLDTIAATWWGRFSAVTVGERLPAGPPRRLHDPALFVDRARLLDVAARHGVRLALTGLRPDPVGYVRWLGRRADSVRMVPTRSTAGLFQGVGVKEAT
jgi:2-polyprenyl-6-hydroxyphenyl methylase/3-demethylubiquinone-9 3-methyltransferase